MRRLLTSLMSVSTAILFVNGVAAAPESQSSDLCRPTPTKDWGVVNDKAASRESTAGMAQPRVEIIGSGAYCLRSDLIQTPMSDSFNHTPVRSNHGDQLATISADGVLLDLGGNVLANRWVPDGFPLIRFYRSLKMGGPFRAGFLRTTIRNGTLLSPGKSGVGIDFRSFEYKERESGVAIKIPEGETLQSYFRDTGHLIESLTLDAELAGILIAGKGNVIRNNRIVVSGDRAIVSTGPNLILEGNVIEVRGTITDYAKAYGHSLPVQLIQADGAIVRNNRIRFIGSANDHRPEAAFDVIESRDVLFENNTIEAIPALERHDAASSLR